MEQKDIESPKKLVVEIPTAYLTEFRAKPRALIDPSTKGLWILSADQLTKENAKALEAKGYTIVAVP